MAKDSKVGIVNYGGGNTQSVCNAIEHLGINYILSGDPKALDTCSHLILPGVGSYRHCMESLEVNHLVEFLGEQVLEKKKFFLGICVGMQLLTETGHEFGEYHGLGWLKGACDKIDVQQTGLHLPHVGWNEVAAEGTEISIFRGIEKPTFYFVHSYAIKVAEPIKSASCFYGGRFTVAVQKENIFGVQFHPEKSQRHGLAVLKNFCELA